MVAPLAVVGSMVVKGVFKGGSLLSGLATAAAKLKRTGMEGKSVVTEMKRMTGHAKMLAGALTGISVAGFTALMMSAPQLAGSLAKIKNEMTLMAWAIGAQLKPALDAVATILRGIRTGDWTVVKQGVKELTESVVGLVGKGIEVVLEPIIGEKATKKVKTAFQTVKTDFSNWVSEVWTALEEGRGWDVLKLVFVTPLKWVWNNRVGILSTIKSIMDGVSGKLFTGFREGSPLDNFTKKLYDLDRYVGQSVYDATGINLPGGQAINTTNSDIGKVYQQGSGTYIDQNGMMGITGSSDINVDLSGATIYATSEEDVKTLADRVAVEIALKQQSLFI